MSERVALATDSSPLGVLAGHRDGIAMLESSNTQHVFIARTTLSSRGAKRDATTCRRECTSRDPLRHLGKKLGSVVPHLGRRSREFIFWGSGPLPLRAGKAVTEARPFHRFAPLFLVEPMVRLHAEGRC